LGNSVLDDWTHGKLDVKSLATKLDDALWYELFTTRNKLEEFKAGVEQSNQAEDWQFVEGGGPEDRAQMRSTGDQNAAGTNAYFSFRTT
jgi:hypothetical protein